MQLECSDFINRNYLRFKAAPGQFDVPRPYQASTAQGIHRTATQLERKDQELTAEPLEPDVAGHASESSLQIHGSPRCNLPEPTVEQPSDQSRRKRRRTSSDDPQAHIRRLEAQQRHDAWRPVLLAASELLQHYIKQQNSKSNSSQSAQVTDASANSSTSLATHHIISDTDASLDLVALHELRHVMFPKFSWLDSSDQEVAESNLFDSIIYNDHCVDRLGQGFRQSVLIQSQASFLLSDVKRLSPLLPGEIRILLFLLCFLSWLLHC